MLLLLIISEQINKELPDPTQFTQVTINDSNDVICNPSTTDFAIEYPNSGGIQPFNWGKIDPNATNNNYRGASEDRGGAETLNQCKELCANNAECQYLTWRHTLPASSTGVGNSYNCNLFTEGNQALRINNHNETIYKKKEV